MIKMFTLQVKAIAICGLFSLFSYNGFSQVGIGNTDPDPSSFLEIGDGGDDKGILIPRVNIVNLDDSTTPVSSPSISLLVFNTNTSTGPGFFYWSGSVWTPLAGTTAGPNEGWALEGNAGTTPGTNYVGTSDTEDFIIATNASPRMRFLQNGKIAVNANQYQSPFDYDRFVVYGGEDEAAIRGYAGSYSGSGFQSVGVWGENEQGGRGVTGTSREDSGIGVFGSNGSGNGVGVQGVAFEHGNGVEGSVNTWSNGYAVFAIGNSGSSGTKSFVIDDPRDPANKILKHFSLESNEVLNIYRGTETFNANGSVVVNLPDYYEAINKNASYQLTPVGGAMPNLYISKEVNDGTFVISGGIPGKKVSWAVTAERNDPYLKQYPNNREVELDKGEKSGKYLMPDLYGQPKEKGYSYYGWEKN